MGTNGSQEERSYGMAVGLFFALFIGQNLIGMIIFGTYATGILPLIECIALEVSHVEPRRRRRDCASLQLRVSDGRDLGV